MPITIKLKEVRTGDYNPTAAPYRLSDKFGRDTLHVVFVPRLGNPPRQGLYPHAGRRPGASQRPGVNRKPRTGLKPGLGLGQGYNQYAPVLGHRVVLQDGSVIHEDLSQHTLLQQEREVTVTFSELAGSTDIKIYCLVRSDRGDDWL